VSISSNFFVILCYATACGQKCVIMVVARTLDLFSLPVKFKHRKHYFNISTYLTFLNVVMNPFCAITEQIRHGMNVYS